MQRSSLLLSAALLVSSGCFARFDGEGPIGRGDQGWQEVGGGETGVLLRGQDDPQAYRITSSKGVREFRTSARFESALVTTSTLCWIDGSTIVEHQLSSSGVGKGHVLAKAEGAKHFVLGEGELAVATPGLVLAGPPDALRGVWEGEAAALAIDSARRRLWIASRGDVRAIDCIHLDTKEVTLRISLPAELDTASLRIVLSGTSAVVYGLDRPIQHALLIVPESGRAFPLMATQPAELSGSTCDDGSVPPFIAPAAYVALPENTRQDWLPRGRVVPYPGDRFLVLDGTWGNSGRLQLTLVGNRNNEGCAPVRTTMHAPERGPGTIEGVAWDEHGVVLTCRDQRIVCRPPARGEPSGSEPVLHELDPGLTALRRGVNHALNVVILAVEVPLGTALVAGAAGLVIATFPIWIWPVLGSIR